MAFRNSILAGEQLVRSGIRSENYEPGVAGWRIGRDGAAEFSDAAIRGRVVVGDPTGQRVEIIPDYDGVWAPPGGLATVLFYEPDSGPAPFVLFTQGDRLLMGTPGQASYLGVDDFSGFVIAGPGASVLEVGGYDALAPWIPYDPVNVNITKGSGGIIEAAFMRLGHTCWFRWQFAWGVGSAIGGNIAAGLPFPAAGFGSISGWARDVAANSFAIGGNIPAGATSVTLLHDRGTNAGVINATNPWTPSAGDSYQISGVYEV